MLNAYLAVLALAATVLVVSGCGGSSKTTTTTTAAATTTPATTAPATTTPATTTSATVTTVKLASGKPLSRATWIAKGDVICAHANAELDSSTVKSLQDLIRLLPQAALYDKTESAELSKLVPPASKAGDWKKIVVGFQVFGEDSDKIAADAAAGNNAAGKAVLLEAEKIHEGIAKLAGHDGFIACSVI